MALGDLSSDQQRYVAAVSAGTGLDAGVVTAWVAQESGWGVTKPSRNYLNIGPGRTYGSTDQAAAAVVRLINTSGYYAGVRDAIPAGPAAQVAAIQASPWDAAGYDGRRLMDTYQALLRVRGGVAAAPAQLAGWTDILPPPFNGFFGGGLPGFIKDPLSDAGKAIVEQLLPGLLGLVFSLAAFGLIALGLARLTDRTAGDVLRTVQGDAGGAASAAKLAAI